MTRQLTQVPPDAKFFEGHERNFAQYNYAPAVRAGGLLFISMHAAIDADDRGPSKYRASTLHPIPGADGRWVSRFWGFLI